MLTFGNQGQKPELPCRGSRGQWCCGAGVEANSVSRADLGHSTEKCGAAGKTIFGVQHPLYMWSLLHACWLHNRFCVQHGLTPFERATGCLYEGKVCCYGEAVLGYLRTTAKAGPKWQKGVWLGKTTQNDVNILATDKGIFLTRSVRRIPGQWDLTLCGEVIACPWEHGYGSLGGRMILNKKVEAPSCQCPTAAGRRSTREWNGVRS